MPATHLDQDILARLEIALLSTALLLQFTSPVLQTQMAHRTQVKYLKTGGSKQATISYSSMSLDLSSTGTSVPTIEELDINRWNDERFMIPEVFLHWLY